MSIPRSIRRHGRAITHPRSRGQTIVEFALLAPVMLLVLLMALDFGRVYMGWVSLHNSARIAANYAAQNPTSWTGAGNSVRMNEYQTLVGNDIAQINCDTTTPFPVPVFPAGTAAGGVASVTLTCNFTLITPLIGNILGQSVPVSATAVYPIRSGIVPGASTVPVVPAVSPSPSPTPTPSPSPSPSPGVSPDPSPDPSPSPTPTPSPVCTVPNLNNTRQAQREWTDEGFTTNVIFVPLVPPDYPIASQSLQAGSIGSCDRVITVYAR